MNKFLLLLNASAATANWFFWFAGGWPWSLAAATVCTLISLVLVIGDDK